MRTPFRHVLLLLFALLIQSCGGGGGGASSNPGTTVVHGHEPDASSFVNKATPDFPSYQVPDLSLITPDGYTSLAGTLAVADFQQLWQYSAFVVGTNVGATPVARAYFLKYDTSLAKWVDISCLLFASDTDRVACTDPRQGLVTDMNSDKKPDVYLVCAGAGGVAQLAFISNSDGKYSKYSTNFHANANSASIADINGDTFADIITTDEGSVYRVFGGPKSDLGTTSWFASSNKSLVSISQSNGGSVNLFPSYVMNVFLISRDKEIYLVTGGYGSSGGLSQNVLTWHKNFGGYFNSTSSRSFTLPSSTPDVVYRFDYVESESYGYVYTTGNSTPFKYAQLFRISQPNVDDQNKPIPGGGNLYKFNSSPTYVNPTNDSWAPRMIIKSSRLVPYDAGCKDNPVNTQDQRCMQSFFLSDINFGL